MLLFLASTGAIGQANIALAGPSPECQADTRLGLVGCEVETPSQPSATPQPVAAPGGGTERHSECSLQDPALHGAGPETLFRPSPTHPGEFEQYFYRACTDPADSGFVWVYVGPDMANPMPQVTVADLVPGLRDRVSRQLPSPTVHVAPADTDAAGFAYVQAPTFFWAEETEAVSARASVPGLWAEATAVPAGLIVDAGDGSAPTVCAGTPPPFPAGGDPGSFAGCAHTYRDSSATAANGATFPVRVAIEWHVTWTSSTGEGGDLGMLRTTAAARDLPVAEIQAVGRG